MKMLAKHKIYKNKVIDLDLLSIKYLYISKLSPFYFVQNLDLHNNRSALKVCVAFETNGCIFKRYILNLSHEAPT